MNLENDFMQEPVENNLNVQPYPLNNITNNNKLSNTNNMQLSNNRSNTNLINKNYSQITNNMVNSNLKIKPRFYKILAQILNYHFDGILDYLGVNDLARLRQSNKMFLALVHEYYPKRLNKEVERVRLFQEDNYEIFFEFMNMIDSQIPICKDNWLDFDINIVIEKLKVLDKNTITNLKSIKSLGKLSEVVFAPFCTILGYNVSYGYGYKIYLLFIYLIKIAEKII